MGDYKYALVNDVLDHAVAQLRAIVLTARGENGELRMLANSCLAEADSNQLRPVLSRFH